MIGNVVQDDRVSEELARIHRAETYERRNFARQPAKCHTCGARTLPSGERALTVTFEGKACVITCGACGKVSSSDGRHGRMP
jgi:hypothetical protein